MSLEQIQKAVADCQKYHGAQTRKYTGAPYWHHPFEVYNILVDHGIDDLAMLQAALFHDLFEDTDVDRDYIYREYGRDVYILVCELTDDKIEGNRAVRKAHDAERLGKVSDRAKAIKCADLISNTADIVENDPNFAKLYLKEKEHVLSYLDNGLYPSLLVSAKKALEDAKMALATKLGLVDSPSDNPSNME